MYVLGAIQGIKHITHWPISAGSFWNVFRWGTYLLMVSVGHPSLAFRFLLIPAHYASNLQCPLGATGQRLGCYWKRMESLEGGA